MNKIKIYTSPLLKEEFELFSKFHDLNGFYILLKSRNFSKQIASIFFYNDETFVLYNSPSNNIFKQNKQYYLHKLLDGDLIKREINTDDYNSYLKYL